MVLIVNINHMPSGIHMVPYFVSLKETAFLLHNVYNIIFYKSSYTSDLCCFSPAPRSLVSLGLWRLKFPMSCFLGLFFWELFFSLHNKKPNKSNNHSWKNYRIMRKNTKTKTTKRSCRKVKFCRLAWVYLSELEECQRRKNSSARRSERKRERGREYYTIVRILVQPQFEEGRSDDALTLRLRIVDGFGLLRSLCTLPSANHNRAYQIT